MNNIIIGMKNKKGVCYIERKDTQTNILSGIPKSAICVQRFDDSLRSAIHITYRISLRSSSLREPRYPLLKVVFYFVFLYLIMNYYLVLL